MQYKKKITYITYILVVNNRDLGMFGIWLNRGCVYARS